MILCERCGKTLVRTYYQIQGDRCCVACAGRAVGLDHAPWPHVLGGQGRDADAVERDGMACALYGAVFVASVVAYVIYYAAT